MSAPDNPYTKGSVSTNTAYKVGDSYFYRVIDTQLNREEKPNFLRVTGITDNEVIFNDGRQVFDFFGNRRKRGDTTWSPNQTVPMEFVVGKRWNTRFRFVDPAGNDQAVNLDFRVADREKITVPAGTFYAFRIEASGWARGGEINNSWAWKEWFAPDQVRLSVAWEWVVISSRGFSTRFSQRLELAKFRQT